MAGIDDKIAQIRGASLGSEVRESIASGIELCYANTDKYENATAEVEATLAAGANASVRLVNSSGHKVFKFSIPRGATGGKGDKGDTGSPGTNGVDGITPNITIGTVTTGDPGTDVSVTRTGTSANPVFNFTIPRGANGDDASIGMFASDFIAGATYQMGDLCVRNNSLFMCKQSHTASSWNNSYWKLISMESAMLSYGSILDSTTLPNANNAAWNRIYLIGSISNVSNLPYNNAIGMLVTFGESDTGSQFFMAQNGDYYGRYKNSGSWSGWQRYETGSSDGAAGLITVFTSGESESHVWGTGRYDIGDIVVYNGDYYVCKRAISTPGPFNSADWDSFSTVYQERPVNLITKVEKTIASSLTYNLVSTPTQEYPIGSYHYRFGARSLNLVRMDADASRLTTVTDELKYLNKYYTPFFDTTKTYRAGSIVRYGGSDLLYIFRKAHVAGPWDSSEVAAVSYAGGVVFPITEWLLDTWNDFAPQYDSTQTYAVGEYVCWNGPYLYRCTTAITTPEAWNGNHWLRVSLGGVAKAQSEKIEWLYGEIAQSFSTSATYSRGDFVTYNYRMYRFKEPHTGAWDSSHVDEVVVGSQLKNLANSIAPRYNPSSTYKIGSFVIYGTALYLCTQDIDTPEPFDSSHWVGASAVNYLVLSNGMIGPTFSDSTTYYPGQLVIYNNRLYRVVRSHQGVWDANDFIQIAIGNQLFTLANSFTSQYSPARSYKVDDYCVIAGAIYRCIEDINTPELFNEAHWYRISALGVCDAISSFIAPKFSTAKRYGIGEFCVRNNQLYRFTSPHLEGAWNDNDVEQTNLSDTLSGVSTGVILKSPNGTRFQLSVSNDGTLSASAVE